MDATAVLLGSKGLVTVDEMRRGIESLEAGGALAVQTGYRVRKGYDELSYYERWCVSCARILQEHRHLSAEDLLAQLPGSEVPVDRPPRVFVTGDRVRVKHEDFATPWSKPHLRTPGYIFGCEGEIERVCGEFGNPERLAFRSHLLPEAEGDEEDAVSPAMKEKSTLYRVRFTQRELWGSDAQAEEWEGANDTVEVEIYQNWLVDAAEARDAAIEAGALHPVPDNVRERMEHSLHGHDHGHGHSHDHSDHGADNGDPHEHLTRLQTELVALEREAQGGQSEQGEALVGALTRALAAKGLVTGAELRAAMEAAEAKASAQAGGAFGARIVARAWTDKGFRQRLLADATAACAELDIVAANNTAATVLTCVENTAAVHNVIVCTLCSCYPRSILGMSPDWYKSRSYRSRAVREPRAVLREFGTELPREQQVRVHDSTADLRYIVLPRRPAGTDGWTEGELAALVTRDSLIGVTVPMIESVE